jgi:hypothetical protein
VRPRGRGRGLCRWLLFEVGLVRLWSSVEKQPLGGCIRLQFAEQKMSGSEKVGSGQVPFGIHHYKTFGACKKIHESPFTDFFQAYNEIHNSSLGQDLVSVNQAPEILFKG